MKPTNVSLQPVTALVTAIPAHVGHWAVNLIYAAPVFILGAVLLWDWWRHRGEEDDEGDRAPEPEAEEAQT